MLTSAAKPLVAGREERADVAEPCGAEDRVGERVSDHVAVGVPGEAFGMLEANAGEHERDALRERVRVDADADAQAQANAPGSSSSELIRIADAGGSCR